MDFRFMQIVALPIFAVAVCVAANAQGAPQTSPAVQISQYENSDKDFQRFAEDVMQASKANDQARLLAYTRSLLLPDADAWFVKSFGKNLGAQYAAYYSQMAGSLDITLADTFLGIAAQGYSTIQALRLNSPCEAGLKPIETSVLVARQSSNPLYVVRFFSGDTSQVIRFFSYADGGFRYLRDLNPRGPHRPPSNDPSAPRMPRGLTVAAPQITHRVSPVYPDEARRNGIKGSVKLNVVVSKTGDVGQVIVLGGPCELMEAAYRAVMKWTFKPTIIVATDGSRMPIENELEVSVDFKLPSR
jgi:TonB family protein